jgi:pyruvate kinase
LEHIPEIIDAADAVMVARGDLGVEMDLPAVPIAQKRIARLCQHAGKPCVIATQMLESMTNSLTPTRAEVSDVANAVLDHTDAVMLSGETAIGKFPVETATMMAAVVT